MTSKSIIIVAHNGNAEISSNLGGIFKLFHPANLENYIYNTTLFVGILFLINFLKTIMEIILLMRTKTTLEH